MPPFDAGRTGAECNRAGRQRRGHSGFGNRIVAAGAARSYWSPPAPRSLSVAAGAAAVVLVAAGGAAAVVLVAAGWGRTWACSRYPRHTRRGGLTGASAGGDQIPA